MTSYILIVLAVLAFLGYRLGRGKAEGFSFQRASRAHSLPAYHGFYVALWCLIPAIFILILWGLFHETAVTHLVMAKLPPATDSLDESRLSLVINDIRNLAAGNITSGEPDDAMRQAAEYYAWLESVGEASLFVALLCASIAGIRVSLRRVAPEMKARLRVEGIVEKFLLLCSTIAIITTVGIVLSVLFEAVRFFELVSIPDFLFGLHWSPQIALRQDQVGAAGAFGSVPLLVGTIMISSIGMFIAAPIGLLSAIYMSEYASDGVRSTVKPMLEILAGIPTVVYGYFAALTVAPFIRDLGERFGFGISSESALAAGIVMGIMIIPFVSSLSDDVLSAVPQAMKDASLGLGATKSETIILVLIPAALPGIVASLLLAVSRAIGETMIVVMAAGLTANLTANPFEAVTTVTVQIVTLLIGDQEFDSPKTLAAFALGLLLFVMTLCLNIVALCVVRRYREQYE